jgi:hypothetical protein
MGWVMFSLALNGKEWNMVMPLMGEWGEGEGLKG